MYILTLNSCNLLERYLVLSIAFPQPESHHIFRNLSVSQNHWSGYKSNSLTFLKLFVTNRKISVMEW